MLADPQLLRVIAAQLTHEHGKVKIPPGAKHALHGSLRLSFQGSIEQLPAQKIAPTVTLPLVTVLAIVGERGGFGADEFSELVLAAAIEATGREESATERLGVTELALSRAKDEVAARLPKVMRNGPLQRVLEIADVQIDGAKLTVPAPARKKARK